MAATLYHAVAKMDLTEIRRLTTEGHDVNAPDEVDGSSQLHIVAKRTNPNNPEHRQVANFLLTSGANVNARNNDGKTPLHIAAREGQLDLCKLLIGQEGEDRTQAKIGTKDLKSMTALHFAAREGHTEVVIFLIETGADPHILDKKRYLPLHHAAEKGHHGCCEVLSKYYKEKEDDKEEVKPLILAATKGYHRCCKDMIAADINVNQRDVNGNTALHIAARQGYLNSVIELIEMGADPNMLNKVKNTPLMEAVLKVKVECVSLLIEGGTDLSKRNKCKNNVLHLAANKKSSDIMKLILENENASQIIDAKNGDNMTALTIAVEQQDQDCLQLLLDNNASVSRPMYSQISNKPSLLHIAAQSSTPSLLRKVLKFLYRDVNNNKNIEQETPLHVAARHGSREVCCLLLKYNSRVNIVDSHGRTAAHVAAHYGHVSVLRLLMKYDTTRRSRDDKKDTALHTAAAQGHLECCKVLLQAAKGIEKEKNEADEYAIDIAFKNGHPDVLKELLDSITNNMRHLPKDLKENLHQYTHDILDDPQNENNRLLLASLLESNVWEACLRMGQGWEGTLCTNFRRIIKQQPHLAEKMLNRCVTGQDHTPHYDFRFLNDAQLTDEGDSNDDKSSTRHQSKNCADPDVLRQHPVRLMIHHKRSKLLHHRLTQAWITCKWYSSVRFILGILLLQKLFSVGALISYIRVVRNYNQVEDQLNLTQTELCTRPIPNAIKDQLNGGSSLCMHLLLLLSLILQVVIEVNGFVKMGWDYSCKMFRCIRLPCLVLTSALLVPTSLCDLQYGVKTSFVWQCGIVALMMEWLHLLHMINYLPSMYLFITITPHFAKSFLKAIIYVSMVILAWAFIFHVLLPEQPGFMTVWQATIKMVVWMRGDLGYDDTFINRQLEYPILVNLLFLIYICAVAAFFVGLIKMPSLSIRKMQYYKACTRAYLVLRLDACFPIFSSKACLASCHGKHELPFILSECNKLCTSFILLLNKPPYSTLASEESEDSDETDCEKEDSENISLIQDQLKEVEKKLDNLINICSS